MIIIFKEYFCISESLIIVLETIQCDFNMDLFHLLDTY